MYALATAATTPATDPAELLTRDRWPRDRLLAFQSARLRELLRHALHASPYYREVLGADAEDAELTDLPTLSKATLTAEFDRIVTDPRLLREDVSAHASGDSAAEPLHGCYRVFGTSGTTGTPGLIVYSVPEFVLWVAGAIRSMHRLGIGPTTRLAAIGAPHPLHITRQLFANLRSGRSDSPELAVTAPMDEMVATLNQYRPEAVVTYASLAGLLADQQLRGRLRIGPRRVIVSSEVLTDDVAVRIRDAWGVEPINIYAATEAPCIAVGSDADSALEIAEDLVIVESVDVHGRPVAPGTPGNKVLLTSLTNHAQPLIRYELSDSIVLAAEPSPSGRPYARIERVDGRSDDILQFCGRDGGVVSVHPYRLRVPFVALREVRQYQLVYDGEALTVRLVLDAAAPSDTASRVQAAITAAIETAGATPPRIHVTPIDAIEREPGHAAKFKLVKRVGAAT